MDADQLARETLKRTIPYFELQEFARRDLISVREFISLCEQGEIPPDNLKYEYPDALKIEQATVTFLDACGRGDTHTAEEAIDTLHTLYGKYVDPNWHARMIADIQAGVIPFELLAREFDEPFARAAFDEARIPYQEYGK